MELGLNLAKPTNNLVSHPKVRLSRGFSMSLPPKTTLSVKTQNLPVSGNTVLTPQTLQLSPISPCSADATLELRQALKLKNKIILQLMMEKRGVSEDVKDLYQELVQLKASVEQASVPILIW
jgi:hypothetical protein